MKRKKITTSKKVLVAAISAILLFWIAEIVLLITDHEGFPDMFIKCWYTFWSVELAAMAGIKITKVIKNPYGDSEEEDEIHG